MGAMIKLIVCFLEAAMDVLVGKFVVIYHLDSVPALRSNSKQEYVPIRKSKP